MRWARDDMAELLLEAGRLGQEAKKDLRRELKSDASIVTQADRGIEELLSHHLEDPAAGVHIIGEETIGHKGEEYIQRALREKAYVIDPIDGTSPYAHGLPNWGISVARMERGTLVDGAVFLPDYNELVLSEGNAVVQGERVGGRWEWSRLAPAPPPREGSGLVGITQALAKRGTVALRNPVQVLGAAVVPLVGLVQGRFVAYLGSVKLWDAAGSLALILRHGFSISVRAGDEIRRVGPEVDDRVYHLEPSDPRRWWYRSDLLICHSEDEERMREALTPPQGER